MWNRFREQARSHKGYFLLTSADSRQEYVTAGGLSSTFDANKYADPANS
jgi:hypothetical protein